MAVRYGVVPASLPTTEVLRLPHNILSRSPAGPVSSWHPFIAVPVLTIARTFRTGGPTPLPVQAARGAHPPRFRPAWSTSTSNPARRDRVVEPDRLPVGGDAAPPRSGDVGTQAAVG